MAHFKLLSVRIEVFVIRLTAYEDESKLGSLRVMNCLLPLAYHLGCDSLFMFQKKEDPWGTPERLAKVLSFIAIRCVLWKLHKIEILRART